MGTYYVKAAGGTGSGLDDANAWSAAKFASMQVSSLSSGDIILFKRGDSFPVKIQSEIGGLTYGNYSSGALPIITGLTQLSSWTLSSGNIYYATLDVPTLNAITYNGVIKSQGRYPKTGYLIYSGHTSNASINGTSVGAIPFDPAGGEVVIRKERFIIDRHVITSRSGNTLNYSAANEYGNNTNYSGLDGNGYFIQSHLSAVTQEGDWYYDNANNRLYVHFGSGTPTGNVIKACTLDKNIQINSWNNITCNGLNFEGANEHGAWIIGAGTVAFNGCAWTAQGGNAIYGGNMTGVTIDGCTITDSFNNGVMFEYSANNITVNNTVLTNSGIVAGAGRSGDAAQCGIFIAGIGAVITNNRVINSGYNAIDWTGDGALVEKNLVDTYCTIKDDGGGIYNFIGLNGIIRKNIVLNAVGAYEGANWGYWEPFGKAAGIYLDNGADNHYCTVTENVVANGDWAGIFINNNGNNTITNNLVYNCRYQFAMTDFNNIPRNITLTGNTFIAKTAEQFCFRIEMGSNDTLSLLGTFNNNIYARPVRDTDTFSIYRNYAGASFSVTNIDLATWKSTYSQDAASVKSSVTLADPTNMRFDYNYTAETVDVILDVARKDVSNTSYTTKTLPAYGGSVLLRALSYKLRVRNGKILTRNGKALMSLY